MVGVNLDVNQIPPHLTLLSPQHLAPDRQGEEVLATLLHMADLNPGPLVQLGQLVALQVEHLIVIVVSHIQLYVQV